MDHICEPDFGLTRGELLRKSRLHGGYADSDRVLLAELILYGRFFQIPDYLFFRRAHPLQSKAIAPDRRSRTIWFDPARRGQLIFPHFRQFREYLSVIRGAPIARRDRLALFIGMLQWLRVNRGRLLWDLREAGRQAARPVYRKIAGKSRAI
jgi:hypothetical protein